MVSRQWRSLDDDTTSFGGADVAGDLRFPVRATVPIDMDGAVALTDQLLGHLAAGAIRRPVLAARPAALARG